MIDKENRSTCPLCLEPQSAELRFDRKNRPYLVCSYCGSRAFLHHPSAMTSVLGLAPHIAEILRSRGTSLNDLRREAYNDDLRRKEAANG